SPPARQEPRLPTTSPWTRFSTKHRGIHFTSRDLLRTWGLRADKGLPPASVGAGLSLRRRRRPADRPRAPAQAQARAYRQLPRLRAPRSAGVGGVIRTYLRRADLQSVIPDGLQIRPTKAF